MIFNAAAISNPGPRNLNEDEVIYWSPTTTMLIGGIADGLGGMGGGSDASRIAISALKRSLNQNSTQEDLVSAAEFAHNEILAIQKLKPQLKRMATTLTFGIFNNNSLIGIHCGDSRASIARGEGIRKLTTDHSERERLLRAGKITKKEFNDYPRKNILESAIGGSTPPQIDSFNFDLQSGDKIFFTTDGVHEIVKLREMRAIAEHHVDANKFVNEIVQTVESRSPDDNFSILAVFVL